MAVASLHELNQRYVRLTDRCRSQWTFYQLLHGLFKHLRDSACPLEIDFPALFARLRELGQELSHPDDQRTQRAFALLITALDENATALSNLDGQLSPSLFRRFFDRLRTQDEKVILAIIKFYLDCSTLGDDALDKLDLLFTRLAEIPRGDGSSLVRERHEIERLVQPLLASRRAPETADHEIEILLNAVGELRGQVQACRGFSELVSGGALDRFRTLKHRLGERLLHPSLLPVVVETTITIKNRFRELYEDEEAQILDDTNRVMELKRQLAAHPEIVSAELREAMERFDLLRQRFDRGREDDNLRREDVVELRRTLTLVLDQFDVFNPPQQQAFPAATEVDAEDEPDDDEARSVDLGSYDGASALPFDPLLTEYVSKIVFAIELAGRDRSAIEASQAKELASLRLEPCEVEAFRALLAEPQDQPTLASERHRLLATASALRVRMDDEAREIDRLQRRGSDRLSDLLERATQSLQRASEIERRFAWFIEDALYRGDTERLEILHRSRFRLLRAYSGLWLIHNERGGTSPF